MLRKSLEMTCLLASLSVFIPASSLALQATLHVEEIAVIVNPSDENEQRILVRYEMPDFLASATIIHAQIRGFIDVTTDERQAAVEIEVVPLHTDWAVRDVSWTYPWNTPGGDVDADFRGSFLVSRGNQQTRIDVTDLVRQWAEGRRSNFGAMLKYSDSFGGSFSPQVVQDGTGGVRAPVIQVWYIPKTD